MISLGLRRRSGACARGVTRKKGPAGAESARKKLTHRWGTTGEKEKMSEHCEEGVRTRGTSCFALFFRFVFFSPLSPTRRNASLDCSRGKNCSPWIARDSPGVPPRMAGPLFYFNAAKQAKPFWRLARRRCLPGPEGGSRHRRGNVVVPMSHRFLGRESCFYWNIRCSSVGC